MAATPALRDMKRDVPQAVSPVARPFYNGLPAEGGP